MASRKKATLLARERGFRLRRMLAESGLSTAELAAAVGLSTSVIARRLAGRAAVNRLDIVQLATACGYPLSRVRAELADLGRDRDVPEAFEVWGAGRLESLRIHASTASVVREYAPHLLPGALWTPAYARAACTGNTEREHYAALADVLHAEGRPEWEFLISESVLRLPWGTAQDRAEQVGHLLMVAALPTVRLRVLPTTAGVLAGLGGAFTLLDNGALFQDCGHAGRFSDVPADVDAAEHRYRSYLRAALTVEESRELLAERAVLVS
jgi:transcriptional regulator with XRE-family HTH domain